MSHRIGDKVNIKRPLAHCSSRGVIVRAEPAQVTVRINGTSVIVTVAVDEVTNYSLAARKAWKNMPQRNVGRPKGSRVCDRVSVTIRVNRDLWERFRKAEADGIIDDRTSTLNDWISQGIDNLTPSDRKVS